MINAEFITERTIAIAKEAGKFILNERKGFSFNSVEFKGKNDMVSYVDKAAEEMIVKGLLELIPDAGFITEENTISKKGETYNWIIDPLDGTTNFIHGLPCYCVSIGLLENDRLVLGVIYEPNLDECFHAFLNKGAFLNDQPIRTSGIKEVKNSLMATGFPYTNYSKLKEYMEVFDYCMKNTHGIRRWGSAAIDLAYVAAGRFEGFYEYGLNSWDVAAGILIVQEAGGKVSDFKGENDYLFGKEIWASNTEVHQPFLEVIQEFFK